MGRTQQAADDIGAKLLISLLLISAMADFLVPAESPVLLVPICDLVCGRKLTNDKKLRDDGKQSAGSNTAVGASFHD